MKKFFKIFILTFSILNMSVIYTNCETLSLIEEKLQDVGVPEEYKDNIINYIDNLKLSDKEAKDIVSEANSIISSVKEKGNYSELSFSELLNIYGEALNLAKELNINIDLDLSNKEVVLKDKDSKETLIKCDISDVKKYYENYKESPLTSKDYDELKNYITENTITDSDNGNNSTKLYEIDEYNDSTKNQEIESLDKNDELADSSYNNKESSSENFNSASAIKSKNANRVMSIVFLILFACVIVSLLIDSLFFNKDN
ncbi:hypothetical protein [Clostridium sp. D53t1_180928_C8]|uniref:hypothetical protein n=1 Tax=Clostridium sp. D53t1_180928_C8 TaxID=2787101 RepID=UPI0018AC7687|nr:hypothetical protein [Clostridium sp. D53t1_180928_C8]